METTNTSLDTRRIGIFLAIVLGWSAVFGGLLIFLITQEIMPVQFFNIYVAVLFMPSPAIAHVLTRLITKEGWQGTTLKPRLEHSWPYWLLGWLGTVGLLGVSMVAFFVLFPQSLDLSFPLLAEQLEAAGALAIIEEQFAALPVDPLMALMIIQAVQALFLAPVLNSIFVFGEEFGWRAYLLPKLMPLGPRRALIAHSIVWGLWHAPVIALGYNYPLTYEGAPWVGIGMMTLATIWLGVWHGWLQIKSGTVWPAVLAHATINGMAALAVYASNGEVPALLGPSAVGLLGGLGFVVASVLIMTVPGALDSPEPLEQITEPQAAPAR